MLTDLTQRPSRFEVGKKKRDRYGAPVPATVSARYRESVVVIKGTEAILCARPSWSLNHAQMV
jgi:hypothetical protein